MTGCLNGGSCVPDDKKETFACSCKAPWTGEKCELSKEHMYTVSIGNNVMKRHVFMVRMPLQNEIAVILL